METSGEAIPSKKPQVIEAKETDSRVGLSVNGSSLIALASLNYLEEYGFIKRARPNMLDRLKYLSDRPRINKLNAIKGLILQRKTQEARDLLKQGLVLANPVAGEEDYKRKAIDALSKNISVKEAFDENPLLDVPFRQFIQSLPGKPLDQLPKENGQILLTEVGGTGYIYPESNELALEVLPLTMVFLPLDQQRPLCIKQKEVIGESNNGAALSKLEVFAELAKRYPKVFTHIAEKDKLPTILSAGHLGLDYGRGNASNKRLYVETLTFKDVSKYAEVIQSIKSGNEITIPWHEANLSRNDRRAYNYPLHELTYVNPKTESPVAIFSDQLSQEHKLEGWIMDGNIDIKDKCLIGIWVTPNYRHHLLHWISTWDDEKRQQVFGERKPQDVLISSVKDVSVLEK